ncbi:MAG: alpha/beta hydrolase, partial [Caldilineaceae bacterium]
LERYARRFAAAGYAVLAFDYRHFGSSDGEPRQLIWIPTQLADWRVAIRHAREHKDIDSSRIALWGTSLSGGHVIAIASEDHAIACISAQCPGLDGHESAELGFRNVGWRGAVRLVIHGQRDLVRSWLHLSPHKIPIVGKSGTTALMASDEAWNAMCELAPANYVNEACARIVVRGDKYRPVKKAQHVRCPALLQICDHDEFTPVGASEQAARSMGNLANVKRYPIGHFEIYFGDHFDMAVRDQLAFFSRYL